MKKKNLIVFADFPPVVGGTTIWYYRICELLLEKGYKIFALGGAGNPPEGICNLNPEKKGEKYSRFFLLINDVLIEMIRERKILLELFSKGLLKLKDFKYLVSFLVMIKRSYPIIPKGEGVVLSSHANMNSLLAYLFCKKHGKLKLVIRCHGGGVLEFYKKRPKLVRFLLSQADYVNCVSDYIAEECRKKGARPEKIKIIFSARDIPLMTNEDCKENKENIVLFCGFLEPRKDPMTFIKGIKDLCGLYKEDKQWKFVVIGKGALKVEMQRFCEGNGLKSFVVFTDELSQEQVYNWMKKSKVLVLPSIREPSGAVLTEAMAYRCYCIASKVGGIPEIVTSDRGSLFEPEDYKHLARLMTDYFLKEHSYKDKIDSAYKYVQENYSFEKAADQLDEIFSKIV